MKRRMDAAASPTSTKTPATAPVFEKNADELFWPLLLLNVGSALATTSVTVITTPLEVVVEVVVMIGGAVVDVTPLASVVVM